MAADEAGPIIIKKKKVSGGHGHHGGAWKVAYADFVTAMMAFFLMMWLLNATTEKQRSGIADYFSPTIALSDRSAGGMSMFGGDSVSASEELTRSATGGARNAPRTGDGADDGVQETREDGFGATAPDPATVDPFIKALAHARAEREFQAAQEAERIAAAQRAAAAALSESDGSATGARAFQDAPTLETGDAAAPTPLAVANGDAPRAADAIAPPGAAGLVGDPAKTGGAETPTEDLTAGAPPSPATGADIVETPPEATASEEAQFAAAVGEGAASARTDSLADAPEPEASFEPIENREALEQKLNDPSLAAEDRDTIERAYEAVAASEQGDELLKHLAMRITPEGLLIEIAETARTPLFASASSAPSPVMRALMEAIAPVIAKLRNRVAIVGHTDGRPFSPGSRLNNWTLSMARADAARRLLKDNGLPSERVARISGSADRDPLSEDVYAPENRRIGLTLLREASKRPVNPSVNDTEAASEEASTGAARGSNGPTPADSQAAQ